jgi:hypothetical protein
MRREFLGEETRLSSRDRRRLAHRHGHAVIPVRPYPCTPSRVWSPQDLQQVEPVAGETRFRFSTRRAQRKLHTSTVRGRGGVNTNGGYALDTYWSATLARWSTSTTTLRGGETRNRFRVPVTTRHQYLKHYQRLCPCYRVYWRGLLVLQDGSYKTVGHWSSWEFG